MRRALSPCAVRADGTHLRLYRVEYTDRRVGESFLQNAINQHPALLPVEEIDPSFAPLASLGRELAGIDNLLLSAGGRPVLVETKLWRNPESVREVVRVETTGPASVSVVTEAVASDAPENRQRRTLSAAEFFEALPDARTRALYERMFQLADELGLGRTWRSSSVSLRLADPGGSGRELTLLVLNTRGEIYTGWLQTQLLRLDLPVAISTGFVRTVCSIFPNVSPHANLPSALSRNLTAAEVAERFDELADALRETIEAIRAARQGD